MRVGIVTVYGGSNYGNVLQNYALQQVVERMGYETETLCYTSTFPHQKLAFGYKVFKKLEVYRKLGIADMLWDIKRTFCKTLYKNTISKKTDARLEEFELFRKTYLKISPQGLVNGNDDLLNMRYDKVIAGSDQIWNPYWQGKEDIYFLKPFTESKRIAYAASFGVNAIPQEQQARYTKLIKEIPHISVREQQGAKIIHALTKIAAPLVTDPVFLLPKNKWDSIALEKVQNEPYAMTYFLGKRTLCTEKRIRELVKKNHMNLVDVFDVGNIHSSYVSPMEFLSLIRDAAVIFTDSFHGCAFSVIFNTPFVVCERSETKGEMSMNSRIVSLLDQLAIKGRSIEQVSDSCCMMRFDKCNHRLAAWIQESQDYLCSALKG